MSHPTTGRIVHYTLTTEDALRISVARMDNPDRKGNTAQLGDVVPLIVVRVWDNGTINGQALLDGNDSLWITSRPQGDGPGNWAWPPRV